MEQRIPQTESRLLPWRVSGSSLATLLAIVTLALALRVYQSVNHPFTPDEIENIEVADTIRLSLRSPHIVLAGPGHPLLGVYMAHVGSLLFGKTLLGYRVLTALFGAMTCWAVFLVARRIGNERAGLWAAALLAVDQFHTTLSGSLNSNDVPVILFGTLALLSCLAAIERRRTASFVALGLWLGLAYLGKETAVLLFVAVWGYALSSRQRRSVLTDARWYLAHLVFLVVISPDLWNLATTGGYLTESTEKATGAAFTIRGKALSLFLAEIVMLFDPEAVGGEQSYWCWPLRTMHWMAGALYLMATCVAWRLWRRSGILLLQLCFWSTFLFVTLMPQEGAWDPFWWASMSVSPAVVFAGIWIDERAQSRIGFAMAGLLWGWLLVRTVQQLMTAYCF